MATYEYICEAGHNVLIERGMTEPEGSPVCEKPNCERALKRVYSAPSITFKGSGFYSTSR